MSKTDLRKEEHNSELLASHMTSMGELRPHKLCHAHAIVSGGHPGAAGLRAILAHFKVRIDDPDNGCWLPKNTDAKKSMPTKLRNAVPHSRIHRSNYYTWTSRILDFSRVKSNNRLRFELNMIERLLQQGNHPAWVMNKKDVGVPA
ncbi:MAG: AHH domain-containing protein [Agarilytica sp.]